jgi:rhamnose utilization protein RhaD (predicted bifunctional aldolase and dehydrogenase)/NAD(P)-dependent dehydrogenase (short-subunit alcohol dehydrogenase family)
VSRDGVATRKNVRMAEDRWNAIELSADADLISQLVAASRLLGSDPDLVLHGGGNTSIKDVWTDVTGHTTDALFVKGSGWDLATIERAGFTPLDLAMLRRMLELPSLSDPDMMAALAAAKLDASAPSPSVETLMHALLPHTAILHSHSDAIVNLTNTPDPARIVGEALGANMLVVPYVMPGFDLATKVKGMWPNTSDGSYGAVVLVNHGLFTFAPTAAEAYHHHLALVNKAEQYLDANAPRFAGGGDLSLGTPSAVELAKFRRLICTHACRPMIVSRYVDSQTAAFVQRPDLQLITQRGPLTLDHIIRTKRNPLVGRDVAAYADNYAAEFTRNKHRARIPVTMLDPAPRVILDPEWGMFTAGNSVADADIVADLYHHTMAVIPRAEALGGYTTPSDADLFDVEYWDLEQAKLRKGAPAELAGQVALVTGAASGIGRACALAYLARGAAVVGIDLSPAVNEVSSSAAYLGLEVDVTDATNFARALMTATNRFGGIDHAVIAAGIFGASRPIAELDITEWRKVLSVNLDAAAIAMSQLHPLLAEAPNGGSVILIGSKNVPAPGPGASAYSASKAAVTQLCRVAALEWASDGIRVNIVNPDAVFDTGLWTPELLEERAAKYGVDVETYKKRNLLSVEITSATVANIVVDLSTPRYKATTGAVIPIDGGNDRVI